MNVNNNKVEWKELERDVKKQEVNKVSLVPDSAGNIRSVRLFHLKDRLMPAEGENVLKSISMRPKKIYEKQKAQFDDTYGVYVEGNPIGRNPTYEEIFSMYPIISSIGLRVQKKEIVDIVAPITKLEKTEEGEKTIIYKIQKSDIDKIQIA